nr:YggS family pyridoxal phosphate-dependent enzyme [Mesoaciditoga lauensis]
MLLSIWKTNLGEFTIDLNIDSVSYNKANEEKKSKAFFFRLVELLSVDLTRKELEKVKEKYLRELSFSLAKANGFFESYSPKEGKPFYNSFRNALRVKRATESERMWQNAVEKWKENFSEKLELAVKEYKDLIDGEKRIEIIQNSAKLGWFFSPDVLSKMRLRSSSSISSRSIYEKVRKMYSSPEKLVEMSKKWFDVKYFSRRKKIIRSIINAYERKELELAIYALLPQTEGVVWDFLSHTNPMEGEMEEMIKFQNRKFVTVEAVMRMIMNMISGEDKVPFYRWVKFAEYDDLDHDLNRHAIEHGISSRFGTKENFLKLFLFLDFLHFVISKMKVKSESVREVIRMSNITHNVKEILSEIPEYVHLVAVAKTRTAEEIEEAIRAGVKIIGENYVQEAEKVFPLVKEKAEWHFIGSMQKNKINKIIRIFDMIETINSFEMAEEVDKRCAKIGRIMPILIEVNSGREPQKSGVMPEDVKEVVTRISTLKNVRILGLMTMGPRTGDPEEARPYFKLTKEIFDEIKEAQIPNVSMKFLSMGMSNSYKVAIEEGANVVRIGTKIFGERIYKK